MDDAAFLAAFEAASIPLSEWNHAAHLRVAYTYLRRHPLPEAIDRMRAGIQAYNRVHQVPDAIDRGYHETMTQAFMRVLDAMLRVHGAGDTAEAFFAVQPQLTSRYLLRLYYSRGRIMSAEAKHNFVLPDLAPFPVGP